MAAVRYQPRYSTFNAKFRPNSRGARKLVEICCLLEKFEKMPAVGTKAAFTETN